MAASHQTTEYDAIFGSLMGAAPILRAFIECSDELQESAKEMLEILSSPEADDDDRQLAAITLADILFPNTHEGDKMVGMDLQTVDVLARGHPETKAVLEAMDEEEKTFSGRLGAAMQSAGITQSELARRIGVGQPAIAMMLKRECRPQKRTIERLAEALQVRPSDLWPEA